MTDSQTPNYENAEALRKNKSYAEACEQFAQIWQQNPSPFIGWRYAFCLRKVGQLEDAERVAREALAKYPEDKFTKSELGWILYEKELKPAKEESDLGRIVHVANQVLALNSDGMALAKVVLAVMKVAKGRKNWKVLLEWADRLTPENLDNQPMVFDGKRGMSDRETWCVGRARALLELERFDEACQFAQAGLADFPDEIFLRRTAALALARSGDLVGGIAEMRSLLTHRRADWYMKAELAELEYRAGNYHEAYRLICDAVSTPRQSEEYKLGYFVTLAQIALALGKLDVATEHIALAKAIRSSKGWRIPSELVQVEKDVLAALRASNKVWPELSQDPKQLGRLCRRRWQEGKDEGVQFYRGTVKPYPEGRHFAYIKRDDGGEDVYVIVRDLPRNCSEPGSRVEFALKTSFDKKKGRESVQATNVRCVRE
jgi:tetratricopeptide (TPR) repeat protein